MNARRVRRLLWLGSLAVATVGGGGRIARAQSLRPHILFIFDTSGSMRDDARGNTIGENTNICPSGNTSKLYGLKSALRAALAQAGGDEANFGLMSFPEVVVSNPSPSKWCGTNSWGHYNPTASMNAVAVPNRASTGNHSQTGYPSGCLMTTNTTEETYGSWFDSGVGQVLRVGVTTTAIGSHPAAADFDPPNGNIPNIYKWIDNVELPTNGGAVTDPELHANGYTPLGRSLFYGRLYYDNFVKPVDPKAACRQNVIILVTDGAETCDEATAPDSSFDLGTCAGGVDPDPFHPVVQACKLWKTSGIKTYVVTDSAITGSDLASNNRIAAAGGTGAAITVSLADANAAKAAIVAIIAEIVPPAEVCNGKDDNCNGLIDEGVSNACHVSNDPNDPDNLLGVNAKHCAVEVANCLDDNCNGLIDEGFPPNACGKGAGCPIPPEVCDGLDNNCDGQIDEGFDAGASCDNGRAGTCRRSGIKVCTPNKMSTTCELDDTPFGVEVCNGIDDDCNGIVDDGMLPGVGDACGVSSEACMSGTYVCAQGKLVCNTSTSSMPEVCNGLDDDCNGVVDDGVFPGVGEACLCDGLTQAQVGVGQCRAGHLVCKGAAGIKCEGCVLPTTEICDGKDNNCDGAIDQNAMCASGFGCRDGACSLLCQPGEFPCPPGYDCVNDFCVANRCRNVSCGADQRCNAATGTCVDSCFGVLCMTGQTCMHGACLDCTSPVLACPAGQLCIDRQCVTDRCAGFTCAAGQYCADGVCIGLDCGGACAANEKCVAGQCQPYLCDTVSCGDTDYCDYATGTCKRSLCANKTCPHCAAATGECLSDPCAKVGCPTNGCWSCALTPDGEPYCQAKGDCSALTTVVGASGGGCACDAAGGGDPAQAGATAFGVLALGGMLLRGRRRRRRID